jgi:hypothetical protein
MLPRQTSFDLFWTLYQLIIVFIADDAKSTHADCKSGHVLGGQAGERLTDVIAWPIRHNHHLTYPSINAAPNTYYEHQMCTKQIPVPGTCHQRSSSSTETQRGAKNA